MTLTPKGHAADIFLTGRLTRTIRFFVSETAEKGNTSRVQLGAMPTALGGHGRPYSWTQIPTFRKGFGSMNTVCHAHPKRWAWHPTAPDWYYPSPHSLTRTSGLFGSGVLFGKCRQHALSGLDSPQGPRAFPFPLPWSFRPHLQPVLDRCHGQKPSDPRNPSNPNLPRGQDRLQPGKGSQASRRVR